MCGFGYWNSIFWPWSFFLNVIFWGLIILGVVYLINSPSKSSPEEPKKQDAAMDILRKRYATGEINAEEFAQKKKDLGA